eukprot:CAMPEP_0172577776 /NCGR_PEP_ID=MMETSP1067-20121228/138400_1 /TAXON_ID=265564 ORGANISM="Thalassiosira punctigera, Strain Tpunct2005C2" /NCGR_SAMPLE_ID=MMETSP1067 /ASSEMBLY_ACC=CAM_ASM_000444 /LENGTH=1128 /DNA_ID=CAMNT_0013370467 /DNA_START=246 /DNA_END=3632 /DNA_ORIENTATION=-
MAPVPRYGSISSKDDNESVELLPPPPPGAERNSGGGDGYIGTANAAGGSSGRSRRKAPAPPEKKTWITRQHCLSYTIAALICLFSARYWHERAESYDEDDGIDGGDVHRSKSRVPVPPALSSLDPTEDLGFRSTTRKRLASPSKVWGEYLKENAFTPLPTNQWYLNLLSHRAAADPSTAGEVAHVYTIPYIVGVSPPHPPKLPSQKDSASTLMAGIDLFVPVMKTSSKNMQMVFDKQNGVSLGAIVSEKHESTDEDESSLTSYVVDPDVLLSPLGVSLKWNHVNMKSHIVRGMPYGTMRYGKDQMDKSVLPTIVSGNRLVSILIDSEVGTIETIKGDRRRGSASSSSSSKHEVTCGSLTGKPIQQDLRSGHVAPLSKDGKAPTYSVRREVALHMDQSDFTWVAFFSKPVRVQCYSDAMPAVSVPGPLAEVQFRLDVVQVGDGSDPEEELVVRVALLDECTTGKSIIKQHCDHLKSLGYETVSGKTKGEEYLKALREGAGLYPRSPLVGTDFPQEDSESEVEGGDEGSEDRVTNVVFDWDVASVEAKGKGGVAPKTVTAHSLRATTAVDTSSEAQASNDKKDGAFIMFALPHHLETLSSTPRTDDESAETNKDDDSLCLHTFHGRTCLVRGPIWNLPVEHGGPQSFLADRPPASDAIPSIAEALREDVKFKFSGNVLRGAADTYFPAKILAKVGRVIEINEELQRLQSNKDELTYPDADDATLEEAMSSAAKVFIPLEDDIEPLLDNLQRAVEVWLNPGGKEKGGGEAEFLYDVTWGGFVNCGCKYTFNRKHPGNGTCSNIFPDCPALEDVNEDFGNGWYNDHHFHYGYHIYAAAVVSKHRPEWGRKYYDRILLYIRDIANPSTEDEHFPVFRQKDWYLGNSWAAGLMSMELSPHGREQESSSEAIASFEGIALFGSVMMNVFAEDDDKLVSARLVRNVGELLTAMEVSAANRFWHVWGSKIDEEGSTALVSSSNNGSARAKPHINTYPKEYPKHVVGMMYDTMASFQTWFAPEDVVSYGIQLMPLTAVAERRDDLEWSDVLYPVYAESCKAADDANDGFCKKNGWSIVQAGLLAETGEVEEALEMALKIPKKVFISEGGSGNSLSNTLWFISTRKQSSRTKESQISNL